MHHAAVCVKRNHFYGSESLTVVWLRTGIQNVDLGPLSEFLGEKQNAAKQRICEVSQVGIQTMTQLEDETWRTNHAAPRKGTNVLQLAVAGNRKSFRAN
jgi:hypothetical protein